MGASQNEVYYQFNDAERELKNSTALEFENVADMTATKRSSKLPVGWFILVGSVAVMVLLLRSLFLRDNKTIILQSSSSRSDMFIYPCQEQCSSNSCGFYSVRAFV